MAISHVKSVTIADVTNTNIVRPSDWNSAHNQYLTATGNTTVQSTGSGSNIAIRGAGIISIGFTNTTELVISATAGAGGGSVNFSAGTTSGNLASVTFGNANGVSFGLNAGTITGSHNGLTSQSNHGVSVGTDASLTFNTLIFQNSFGISWRTTGVGDIIVASHNGLTSQSNQAFSADASSTFQTLTFQDSNGVSFSNNAGALRVTHALQFTSNTSAITSNAMHSSSRPAFSADASSTFQTLTLQNSNGVSFSNNAGAVRITHELAFSSQTNLTGRIYVTAQSTGQSSSSTYDLRTLSIVPDGIVSAGWSGGSFRISATQSNQAFNAAGGSSAFQTLSFSDNSNASWTNNAGQIAAASLRGSFYAVSNTTQSTSMTQNLNALSFHGAGIASVGVSNGSVIVSVPSGAPSPVNFSAGTTSSDLGSVVFSDSNGVSFGLNGSTITASVVAAGGATISGWQPYADALWVTSGMGNASLWINPKEVPVAFQYDRFVMPMHFSQATNSTLTVTNTVAWGFYTKNAGSLSLYKSGSGTFSINGSGTASSSNNSGIRIVSLASTDTITAGNYYLGIVWRTTTEGANASLSHIAVSQWASTASGYIGLASNTRMQMAIGGGGVWTSTTAGIPNSLAMSDIRGNSSAFKRQPIVYFTSGEITY